MGCKNCKIVCDDEELATISCSKDGVHIKMTEKGKAMHMKMHKECCE